MSLIGTRKFGGKTYTFFSVQRTKKKANKMVKALRNGDMNTRMVKEKEAGKTIYLIFCRFKDSKA